jgi:hypothetical protein
MEISESSMRLLIKLGLEREMPIMMDYWSESLSEKVFIGVKKSEKILVKNEEEYTSPIKQMFKNSDEYIILTENSIYVVSNKIKGKVLKE